MSNEVIFPPWVQPSDEQSTLSDTTAQPFIPSQAPGLPQRVLFVEPRLLVQQVYSSLRQGDRAAVMSALRRVKGKWATLRVIVGYDLRGSFPGGELLVNGTFQQGTGSWTPINGGGGSAPNLTVADGTIRVAHTTGNSLDYIKQDITGITSGAFYAARAAFVPGNDPTNNFWVNGVTPSNSPAPGIITNVSQVASTGFSARFGNNVGNIAGNFFEIAYASLQRCAVVDSGTWTGNACNVKGLPSSTSGLLLADDLIEINGELKACTAALNSDANGKGYLQFAPAFFRSPIVNDAVMIGQPIGKFILNDDVQWDNLYGVYANLTLNIAAINE